MSSTSPKCDNSALVGTSVTLGFVSGIILPICIALIFYYRRQANKGYEQQYPARTTTQSDQTPNQSFLNRVNSNMFKNQWNQNPGAVYDTKEYKAQE
ncbi:34386_t:CDS:1, partial [Racocetra persica]